jgi:glutamate---cysteine ligase / carboxylate-amine ligase
MSQERPCWAKWRPSGQLTLGIEEELMVLRASDWELEQDAAGVLETLPPDLAERLSVETHGCALELATEPHAKVDGLAASLTALRDRLARELAPRGLAAACAGTHPSATWNEVQVSPGDRYQLVYRSMRELARREPTFALHVHLGVEDPDEAIRLCDRLRAHLPLLLALSANSPFWQGRDSGLASARTPIFQAFPRVGIPRAFHSYDAWVQAVDLLLRCEAFSEPTFLWWDVRPQPRFGTVEVRIMDAQTTTRESVALAALVQSVAALELAEGYASATLLSSPEALIENRFLAARDGMDARLLDPGGERRVPAREVLGELVDAARPHAARLGCAAELAGTLALAEQTGAERQRARAGDPPRLRELVAELADAFAAPTAAARLH